MASIALQRSRSCAFLHVCISTGAIATINFAKGIPRKKLKKVVKEETAAERKAETKTEKAMEAETETVTTPETTTAETTTAETATVRMKD